MYSARAFPFLALAQIRSTSQTNKENSNVQRFRRPIRRQPHTKEAADLKRVIALYKSAQQRNIPFDPAAFGFVFSVQEIEVLIQREQALAALGFAPKAV